MKKFTFFAIIALIAVSFNLRAQNTDNKWAVGINWQFEDFNAVHLSVGEQFQYAKWQGYKFPSALSVGRNLNPSFNLFAQFGVSQLELDRMKEIGQPLSDDKFWTGDLNIAYKFANGYMMKETSWFDPYIFLGLGASSIKDLGATNGTTYMKQVTGVGFNFWLTEKVGLNFQGAYDYVITPKLAVANTENKRDDYMHYTLGLKFRFGGKDTDKDGVKDKVDLCPETPGKVELAGCPDKDNDGIADKDDACPDVAGKPEFKGCPDTDGDGIIDSEDACPTVAGLKELKGCPDKDGDGVADKDDKCPDVAGKKELGGCPDKDGDGIADKDDACPDVKGLAQFKGCPDTDGDGIADKDDKCPDVAGIAANFGCPEVKKFEYYKVVYFATNKTVAITKYTKDLDEVVGIMKDHADVSVNIEGYADSQGNDAYNMKLSEKRADYIINYLVKKGVAKDRLVKKAFGEANPVGDNKTADGRAQNRRVEIKTVK
ncbi:MAG: OmpA family protein [Bacteroidota bacterium]